MAGNVAPITLVVGAVALLVGLVAGGLGPRAEVRGLRAEIDAHECGPASGILGDWLLGGAFPPRGAPGPAPIVATPQPAVEVPGEPTEAPKEDTGRFEAPTDGIAAMEDALSLRYTQARASLAEHASDGQMVDIDGVVATMNDDLAVLVEDFVHALDSGEGPSRRDMMVYAAETLDVMIRTEDELYDLLTAGQIAAMEDSALDPFSYIDPSLVELVEDVDL